MTNTPLITFNELLYQNERENADMVYLRQPIEGQWHDITWKEAMGRARKVTSFLKSLGLQKGDRVAIISKNCAEWIIADFAIAMGGFVSVPLFTTHARTTIEYIFEHSEAKVVFVGKLDNWKELEAGIPKDVKKIDMGYLDTMPSDYKWKDILKDCSPDAENYVPKLEDLYTIVYTSGTTGNPKGVMIPFSALAHAKSSVEQSGTLNDHKHHYVLSYLPLSHIMERVAVEFVSLYYKFTISFVESLTTFSRNLRDTSPTSFLAVPRIWTQFQKGVLEKLPEKKLNLLLSIPIVNIVVKNKIKKELGLSRSTRNVSGSAPISANLLEWFKRIGVEIIEGYGRTEDLAICTCGVTGEHIVGTVGKPWPGIEVKIDDSGEILTRSKSMMSGYYKNPEATAEAMTPDGFMHTGDTGLFDKEGNLIITGRLKDTFKTDKGEFVNPIPIEGLFAENIDIEQSCLIGLNLRQPVLIVVLSQAAMKKSREELSRSLKDSLDSINERLTKFERVSHLIISKDSWTPENSLLTPTLKMKRQPLNIKYTTIAQANADNSESVIWE